MSPLPGLGCISSCNAEQKRDTTAPRPKCQIEHVRQSLGTRSDHESSGTGRRVFCRSLTGLSCEFGDLLAAAFFFVAAAGLLPVFAARARPASGLLPGGDW